MIAQTILITKQNAIQPFRGTSMVSSCLSQCRIHSRKNISHEISMVDRVQGAQRAQRMNGFDDLIVSLTAHCHSEAGRWFQFRSAIEPMAEEIDCMNLG